MNDGGGGGGVPEERVGGGGLGRALPLLRKCLSDLPPSCPLKNIRVLSAGDKILSDNETCYSER